MKLSTFSHERAALLTALVLVLPGIGLLAGCGGSSSSSPASLTGSTPLHANGSASVTILWPKSLPQTPMVRGQLIPAASQSIVITITSGGKAAAPPQTLVRPASGGSATATFAGLPTGMLTITAAAYASTNGTGTAQASASSPVTVQADQVSPVTTLSLSSTITRLTVSSPSSSVALGKTLTLTATALDSAGAVVMTVPGQFQWSSSTTAVATVDANGLMTGVSLGAVTVTVLDTESQQSATAALNVVFPTYTLQRSVPLQGNLLAVDSSGNLYEEGDQSSSGALVKAGPDGTVIQTFSSIPVSLFALDATRNFYVIAPGGSMVQKFDPQGNHLLDFAATGAGQLVSPQHLTVDTQGNVFVADGMLGSTSVKKYNSQGEFVLQFGSAGTGNGQFGTILGIGTDAQGNVYVKDSFTGVNQRVERFDSQGVYLSQFPVNAYGFAVDTSGNTYMLGIKYSPTGAVLATFSTQFLRTADFIAVDSHGNIYQEILTGAVNYESVNVYAPP